MKSAKKLIACSLLFSLSLVLVGCATTPSPDGKCYWSSPATCIAANTAMGAAAGAGIGALTGALTGGGNKVATGAVIGGVAGGVLAFAIAWGKCFACFTKIKSEPVKDYNATKQEVGYNPQQGIAIKINKYILAPSAVAPGDTAKFIGSYYIMFPPEKKEITVTETAILKVYDEKKKTYVEVGRAPESVVVSSGLRKATTEIPIPDNAEEGKFIIVFMVNAEDKSDMVEMALVVTKNRAALDKARRDSEKALATFPNGDTATSTPVANNSSSSGEKSVQLTGTKYLTISAKKTSLRENPDIKAKVVASAKQNERYAVVSTITVSGRKWHQIALGDGRNVWISGTAGKIAEE